MPVFETLEKKKGKKWLLINIGLCFITVFIGVFFFVVNVYWGDINNIVSDAFGFQINFVLVIYILLLVPLVYGSYLVVGGLKCLINSDEYIPHIFHKILSTLIFIIYTIAGIILLYQLSSYARLALQIFEFYTIPIFLIFIPCLISLFYPIMKVAPEIRAKLSHKRLKVNTKVAILLSLITASYCFVFAYPLLFIPSNVTKENLPPKPDLIAHRGGSQLGPENTIEVAEFALDYDIVGWEVDIAISYDGVPFMMHDATLTRTTDVKDVYPELKGDRMDSFKWKQLRKLDAGSWYVEKDPWGLIASGVISKKQAEKYEGVKIPSFEEVLNFSRDNNLYLDFDWRRPPEDHPYYDDFYEILIDMTIESNISLSKIMFPTSSDEIFDILKDREIKDDVWTYDDYDNTGDGYTNEEYRAAYEDDFPVMVYTINSIERFSELWCLGVHWVKTDNPYLFADMDEPLFYLHFDTYLVIWIIIYLASGAVLLGFRLKFKRVK